MYLGIWYAVCYVIYFASFAGNRVVGALITLLSLVLFLAGGSVILLQYLGKRKMLGIYQKKVSYNVVSEYSKTDNPARTFIIADNHDAMLGSAIKDFDLVRKLSMIIAPVSVFVFVLFAYSRCQSARTARALRQRYRPLRYFRSYRVYSAFWHSCCTSHRLKIFKSQQRRCDFGGNGNLCLFRG